MPQLTQNHSRSAAARIVDRNPFSPTFLAEIDAPRAHKSSDSAAALIGQIARRALLLGSVAMVLAHVPLLATTTLAPNRDSLTATDTALLNDIQRRAVQFFLEQSDPTTGFTRDRAPTSGAQVHSPSSIAATGFALTAWCIADSRGWIESGEALRRVRQTLRFVATQHAHEHGFFYHFVDARTGARAWKSEASTIDTALFLQGAIMAREYLDDPETTALIHQIYSRIDWQWALNGGRTLSHGWHPESGFIPHRWDSYSELMGMYLLGVGAPKNALSADSWHAWSREPRAQHDGRTFIQCGPLFTHQFAHGWFDFRGQRDDYADYWQNSIDATQAQREWSAMQSGRFPYWSKEMWGLTASDGPRGYMAWGTPGRDPDQSDGTLVPCAPGGSLPFTPRESLTALHRMRETGGSAVWGRYGFADAFNPQTGWTSPDVIGIDLGIMLVMAENLRTGLVWQRFMRAPEVQRGMKLAGFSRDKTHDSTASRVATSAARDGTPDKKS
jgi:hypothetical protein